MKYSIASIVFCALILSACSDKDLEPRNPVNPGPALLSVKLSQQYLSAARVDSAFATWNLNNQEQRIKMIVRNDSLLTEMTSFNEGNGQLTIHVYSNIKYSNQYFGEFVFRKTVAFQKTQGLSYNGPASFKDAAWFPRVELKDGIGHSAVVALRPDDPYFMVEDPQWHNVYEYVVDRSYWKTVGGIQFAGGNTWKCKNNCADVDNEQFFNDLPARIGSRPWNHISIYVQYSTDPNGGWAIGMEHDIPQ